MCDNIEMTANALRVRRNEIEAELAADPYHPGATEMRNELAEIGIALDNMYMPLDTMKADGHETPMQIRASLGL